MVLKNQLWNDARVKKEALTLDEMGMQVAIHCQPEEGAPQNREKGDTVRPDPCTPGTTPLKFLSIFTGAFYSHSLPCKTTAAATMNSPVIISTILSLRIAALP